jgi:hypothetical protein
MSYRCQNCNKVHYGPALSLIKEIRDVEYQKFNIKYEFNRQENARSPKEVYVDSSMGTEIVSKINVCQTCYESNKFDIVTTNPVKKIVRFVVPREDTQNSNNKPNIENTKHKNTKTKFKSFSDAFKNKHYRDEEYDEEYD